ncbi:PREDICTED: receptor-like protein kinase FERONIA [Tarenaya hassleriana]|uniref:receptor-like protein kinase FERONIA n=1 Tax=Tarenaya hassleriana TaxID=28532 RepID=UPI00053C07FA|nr:PREDICTED: receptor-like protein kinase FERONIA [Tarenaya hassleriana]
MRRIRENCSLFGSLSVALFVLAAAACFHCVWAADYSPIDKIFLSCGESSQRTDSDQRQWIPDVNSKFLSPGSSKPAKAATQDPGVPQVPFMTARIFHSAFTYSFPVEPGRKFLRLYFYANSYDALNATDALFSVSSGPYQLLHNFSVSQTSEALSYAYITKEYVLNVDDGPLNVTFLPAAAASFAFVNGIEIVSMPDIYRNIRGNLMVVGSSTAFTIDNSTALENVFRLNVGGNDISASGDTGLMRSWFDDQPYIFAAAQGMTQMADPSLNITYPPQVPPYIAPRNVYATARLMTRNAQINLNSNLTWTFSVHSDFAYLVRLHFCEISEFVTKINQRVFSIFLNNQTAEAEADVIAWAGGDGKNGVPVYRDYVVIMPGGNPQQDLWLDLHPSIVNNPMYYDAILNGVEIFKINDTSGNLGGPNPVPGPAVTAGSSTAAASSSHSSNKIAVIAGSISGTALMVAFCAAAAYGTRKCGKKRSSSEGPSSWLPLSLYGNSNSSSSAKTNASGSYASSLPSNLCRHFSFTEIEAATNGFDEALLLGVGGFGKVYKGKMDENDVAIKRGNPLSEQGVHEFQTEIEMLSKLRHRHLVSLIGYCEENCEMILVYDYMAYGTLREHLYKTQKPPLPWKQRLEICIGAARGLHYLHTGAAKHTIIHRDVKTTNILLDEKWVAKVSDFGLSKTGPALDDTHVSTVVKGSFGYLDPEYFRRQQLTEKSDVYSYGVVLFEVLCARPPLNPTLPKEQVSLAEWAARCFKKGELEEIIDPYLKGKIAPECFNKYAETAIKCVADQGIERPPMGDVLWNLEFALQLQENTTDSAMDSSVGGRSLTSSDSEGLTPTAVFSQILNPKGR